MVAARGFRSFRKLHEVKLHDSASRFGGPTEPSRSSTVKGFRELTSEGETGSIDDKRTSEVIQPSFSYQMATGELERANGDVLRVQSQ